MKYLLLALVLCYIFCVASAVRDGARRVRNNPPPPPPARPIDFPHGFYTKYADNTTGYISEIFWYNDQIIQLINRDHNQDWLIDFATGMSWVRIVGTNLTNSKDLDLYTPENYNCLEIPLPVQPFGPLINFTSAVFGGTQMLNGYLTNRWNNIGVKSLLGLVPCNGWFKQNTGFNDQSNLLVGFHTVDTNLGVNNTFFDWVTKLPQQYVITPADTAGCVPIGQTRLRVRFAAFHATFHHI